MGLRESIIIYGASGSFDRWYHALSACYTIVGVSDSDQNKKEKIESMGEKFIPPNEISAYYFDHVYITSMYYEEIYSLLVYGCKVERNRILKTSDFYEKEIILSLGDLNPEKTFYVFRPKSNRLSGIFCNILFFLPTLEVIEGQDFDIVMDFQNYGNIYLDNSKIAKENSWEYFFKQPCGEKIQNVYKSKNIILGAFCIKKAKNVVSALPVEKNSKYRTLFDVWLTKSNKEQYKKHIVLNKCMQRIIEDEYCRIFLPIKNKGKKICGVLYRGTDYTKLKTYLHEVQPTIEQIIDTTKLMMNEWGFEYIYFDSEDECAFETFCAAFPDNVIYSERARIKEYPADKVVNVTFERENDEFLKGMEYIRSCYLMARCDFFISGMFAGSMMAHLISEGFEKSFTFALGIYGIDDDSYFNDRENIPIYKKKISPNNSPESYK